MNESLFAARLRAAMERAGLKQTELAQQVGASKAAISQYLSGRNIPGIERMQAIADATGVSFEYLVSPAPVATEPPLRKITVRAAAQCLGKSDQFVRVGLQRGLLPFGNAVPGSGRCWNYYINPQKFRDFVGQEQFEAFFGPTDKGGRTA